MHTSPALTLPTCAPHTHYKTITLLLTHTRTHTHTHTRTHIQSTTQALTNKTTHHPQKHHKHISHKNAYSLSHTHACTHAHEHSLLLFLSSTPVPAGDCAMRLSSSRLCSGLLSPAVRSLVPPVLCGFRHDPPRVATGKRAESGQMGKTHAFRVTAFKHAHLDERHRQLGCASAQRACPLPAAQSTPGSQGSFPSRNPESRQKQIFGF